MRVRTCHRYTTWTSRTTPKSSAEGRLARGLRGNVRRPRTPAGEVARTRTDSERCRPRTPTDPDGARQAARVLPRPVRPQVECEFGGSSPYDLHASASSSYPRRP